MFKERLPIVFIIALLFTLSACGSNLTTGSTPAHSEQVTASPTTMGEPAELPATPTPINLSDVDWAKIRAVHGNPKDCAIFTAQDAGGLYSAEVDGPVHDSGPTQRVIFAPERVSAWESNCLFLAYHLPSSVNMRFYQVTYWIDTPDQATPTEWARVWADAKSENALPVPDIGDEAFQKNGLLTFRKGTTYVTIEVLSNKADLTTPEGLSQQLDLEKQVALKALTRME